MTLIRAQMEVIALNKTLIISPVHVLKIATVKDVKNAKVNMIFQGYLLHESL